MNLDARIASLDDKLRSQRTTGSLGIVGVIVAYFGAVFPLIESKPKIAICITLVIAGGLYALLRWHALEVERKVLDTIRRDHASPR
jgi:hypothetical protein